MSSLRIAILASALVLSAALGLATAKGAEDYLHGGASQYIQGRLQEASVEVEEGLRKYPNDVRLKALAAQLKSMKDQQKKDQGGGEGQGGQGSQQKQDKQDSSQNQKGQDKQDSSKQQQKDQQQKDQDKDKQGKDKQGGDKEKDKQKDKDKNGGEGEPPQAEEGKEGDSTGKGAAPVPPGQMSKDEAERLLNSYQDDEKREQKNMQKRSRKPVEVEEDW